MSSKYYTPHIAAKKEWIAKRVLMPGDPKRAEWMARTFLKHPRLINKVRGNLGYTGTYKGVPVTIMAHGMGIPSLCIYAHELFSFYGAKVIYRVGSCGVYNKAKCNLGDVVLAKYGWSDIPIRPWINTKTDKTNVFFPSKTSNALIKKTAKELNINLKERIAFASTFFYNCSNCKEIFKLTGTSVVEMESFGLFMEAKINKGHAACLLTVSDNIDTRQAMTPHERQTTFVDMARLALESIIKEKI